MPWGLPQWFLKICDNSEEMLPGWEMIGGGWKWSEGVGSDWKGNDGTGGNE
jgi:hypothetical protein